MRRHLFTGALAVLLLAGCGGSGSGTTTPAATSAVPIPSLSGRPDAAHLAAFVAAFRVAYPKLAEGREDRPISNDADNTCVDLRDAKTPAEVTKLVKGRFATDSAVDDVTSAGIIALLRKTACP